jgi:hypothetical protein
MDVLACCAAGGIPTIGRQEWPWNEEARLSDGGAAQRVRSLGAYTWNICVGLKAD